MKAKIFTPVVTIFNRNGTIDYSGNFTILEYLIKKGVDGIVPLGSTGEYPSLSLETKREYLDKYINIAAGRVELLPGTGSENIQDTISLSNYIFQRHHGKIKGVLIISEFYYKLKIDFPLSFHIFLNVRKALFYQLYGHFSFRLILPNRHVSSRFFMVNRGKYRGKTLGYHAP